MIQWRRSTNEPVVLLLLVLLLLDLVWMLLSQQHSPSPTVVVEHTVSVQRRHANVTLSLNPLDADLYYDPARDGDIHEYECVKWRSTRSCSPYGERDPRKDRPCRAQIGTGRSGYCEMRHRINTNVSKRVLPLSCNSLRAHVTIQCTTVHNLLTYGNRSIEYTHDPSFTFNRSQEELLATNFHHGLEAGNPEEKEVATSVNFTRGIVIVVHDRVLLSAYASIRSLRQMGLALPIEVWYDRKETPVDHPLLQALLPHDGVYVRELQDPRATTFYTKLFAVFYSAFDSVLLLDADNFAVKDPTYLFDSAEFKTTGAIFWPDYWRPARTMFNVHEHSVLWQIFGLQYVDMFEQESGQVLIDRRRHVKALNVLMYYGFSMPRVFDRLRLVWGDKDLFRFAWMKTKSSFHMITRPPDSAGMVVKSTQKFCGLTMVQRDATGEILFLHRNNIKIGAEESARRHLWTHIQEFQQDSPLDEYTIDRTPNVIPSVNKCFGSKHNNGAFRLRSIDTYAFHALESKLMEFAAQGNAIAQQRRHIHTVRR